MTVKPMLAATVNDVSQIKFPVLASPKIDGVRCLGINGQAISRSGKPLPNRALQALFASGAYDGLDGELAYGDVFSPSVFRDTTSVVMSHDKPIDVLTYHVFDRWDHAGTFQQRLELVQGDHFATPVCHPFLWNLEQLNALEEKWLAAGAEGVMVRDPQGRYKNGRSTLKEGGLLKVKRFVDNEYRVVGFEERMHNANEAFLDELGHTKRSSHQAGKVGRGDLGALVCEMPDGTNFSVGTGFDDAQRAEIWANRDAYLGRLVTVKHFEIGAKDLPRFPVFKGFRSPIDL